MGYERYPRNTTEDYYRSDFDQDYGRDYGSGRDYSYSSARSYEASGAIGPDRDRYGAQRTGQRDYGQREYGQRDGGYQGQNYGQRRYGADESRPYYGSYGAGGRRFEADYADRDQGPRRDARAPERAYGNDRNYNDRNYDAGDRGFFQRAGDEVRSWFGDDEAERRRERDARDDERRYGSDYGSHPRDADYHSWRRTQIDALDRDYDEYRRENQSKFHTEFGTWRTNRQGQRQLLDKVQEHQEVVGSDGAHVGTVDHVRGDLIQLTKNDQDAGGRHHSFPSSWIQSVDAKVTLSKTADDAKKHWRDEERSGALFGEQRDKTQQDATATSRSTASAKSY